MRRLLITTFALGLLCAGCQTERGLQSYGPSPGQLKSVQQASADWDTFFNQGNAARLAALYAEDAVSMPPNAPTLKGRKAIQSDFEGFFAAHTARHETKVDEIIRDGNLSIERATYRLTFRPRAGGPEVVETGRHLECRQWIGSQWKIVFELWNSDTPPPK